MTLVLDFHTIFSAVSTVLTLGLGIYAYMKNPKSPTHQAFLGVGFTLAWWQFLYLINLMVNYEYTVTQYWARIGYVGVVFIAITMFDYIVHFLEYKKFYLWARLNYYYGVVMSYLFVKTDLIMTGLQRYSWGTYPDVNPPIHLPFVFYFCFLLTMNIVFLIIELLKKTTSPKKKNQIKWVLLGFFVINFSCIDYLPNYGPKFYPFDFYPTGYVTNNVCYFILTYAIVKHKLMDINIIIQKGFIYSILITVLTFIYLTCVLAFEQLFQGVVGYQSTYGSVAITLMIAVIFNPLKDRIQAMVEKTLFKGTAVEIAAQNELLRQQITQSERYKTIAALTSNIVDEIKDPLTALQGYNHFLDKRKDDPEFMEKFKEKTTSEFAKINELLSHLTAYSNPTPLSTQNTQMVKLLNETTALLKSNLMESKIELVKNFRAPEGLQLNVDPSQLRQALSNIIMNSIEAMPMGGELTIETDEVEDRFRITIRDTGPGIPKENLGKVCDPFFTKKEKHAGLGLSIAQGIIENHSGKIRIKSETGQGVEVVLDLPIG